MLELLNIRFTFSLRTCHQNQDGKSAIVLRVSFRGCTFDPLEKYIEAMEENKKLYERLVQTEREKVALLEKVVGKKMTCMIRLKL